MPITFAGESDTAPFLKERPQLFTGSPAELAQQSAIDLVKRRYNIARRANTLDFERFSRYYKLFRNRQVQKNYLGLANLFIPEPYRIVRKKTAKLARSIRSIAVQAEHEEFKDAAIMATHLLNFLRNKMNWFMQERTAIQESRIVGLSWLKVLWNLDKEHPEKPYRGFDLSFHSADEVLLEPTTTIADFFNNNTKWLIHVYEADIEGLKRNPNYDPEAIRLLARRGGGPKTDRTQLELSRLTWLHHNKLKDTVTRKFKIYEYWGKYNPLNPLNEPDKIEKGAEQDYLIVVADNAVVLRNEPNPYAGILDMAIPFVPIVANPVGQEMYPVGDIEPAESLFNELNDSRNQRMDTVTLNIDPPKEVLRSAGVDEKELVPRRGWYFKTNQPNAVRFIPPAMQGVQAAIEEEKVIRSDIQQATGIIDFTSGAEVESGLSVDTARGAIIAKGEADVLTEDEISLLKLSMKMLYRIVLAYAQVFLDRQFTIRVMDKGAEQFYNIDRDAIQGNLDLDVEMKTLQDKTTEQQLKLLLFNQAKTVPGANIGQFFTDVLEAFFDNVNIEEYYQQPQPRQEPPRVAISLKGDLNPMEVDEIYKSMGLDPAAAEPLLRQDFREMMRGNLPEEHESNLKDLELLKQKSELLNSLSQSDQQGENKKNEK